MNIYQMIMYSNEAQAEKWEAKGVWVWEGSGVVGVVSWAHLTSIFGLRSKPCPARVPSCSVTEIDHVCFPADSGAGEKGRGKLGCPLGMKRGGRPFPGWTPLVFLPTTLFCLP